MYLVPGKVHTATQLALAIIPQKLLATVFNLTKDKQRLKTR